MNALFNFLNHLFDMQDFMPRWSCGKWSSSHGWLYVCSDIAIGIIYYTIPFLLFYFIKKRKDLPFQSIFIWFILFIVCCGTTHFIDALMFWFPVYRLNAAILLVTATVSLTTVVVLYKNIPRALNLKSPAQLQKIIATQTHELELANQKLRESEMQFKALVNNNPDAITRIGKDLTYKFVNDSLAKFSTQLPINYIGKTPFQVLPLHPHTQEFTQKLQYVFTTGEHIQYTTETYSSKLGMGYYAVQIIPLTNSLGEIVDVLTITKNITQEKQNELKLQKTVNYLDKLSKRLDYKRKKLEEFAHIVSHNLRSPIGNLATIITLYNAETDADNKEFLIQKNFEVVAQLGSTVQEMMELLNLGYDVETEPEKETLHFETVLKGQINSIYTQINGSGATIEYDFNNCETITYPKVYLESIFLNLLTNAIKYASADKKPLIQFRSSINENGVIRLICTDNGQGIDMKKYGNKLFSLHQTFHQHPDANGIGLFITKNQIVTMGGNIKAESEPDKGTTLTITFNDRFQV